MPRSGPLSWLCPAGQPPSPLEARTRSGLPPAPSRLHLTDRPRHERACGPGARGPVPGGEVTVTPGHRATWACHSHALAHGARQKVRPGPDLPRRQPLREPGSRRDQCPQGQGGPFRRARHPRPADGCWLPRILPSSEQVRALGKQRLRTLPGGRLPSPAAGKGGNRPHLAPARLSTQPATRGTSRL